MTLAREKRKEEEAVRGGETLIEGCVLACLPGPTLPCPSCLALALCPSPVSAFFQRERRCLGTCPEDSEAGGAPPSLIFLHACPMPARLLPEAGAIAQFPLPSPSHAKQCAWKRGGGGRRAGRPFMWLPGVCLVVGGGRDCLTRRLCFSGEFRAGG